MPMVCCDHTKGTMATVSTIFVYHLGTVWVQVFTLLAARTVRHACSRQQFSWIQQHPLHGFTNTSAVVIALEHCRMMPRRWYHIRFKLYHTLLPNPKKYLMNHTRKNIWTSHFALGFIFFAYIFHLNVFFVNHIFCLKKGIF